MVKSDDYKAAIANFMLKLENNAKIDNKKDN